MEKQTKRAGANRMAHTWYLRKKPPDLSKFPNADWARAKGSAKPFASFKKRSAIFGRQTVLSSLYRNKLLNPFAGGDFTRVDVSLRIRGRHVEAVELARQMPRMSNPSRDAAVLPVEDPHHAVHHIGDVEIFLLRVWRKINGARGIVAAIVGNRKFLHELSLLGENLNAVTAAVADVNQPVLGNVHAVHRFTELLRRWISGNAGRQGIVVDLIERNSVGSPAALERSGIGVIHDHAFIQVAVGDVDFVGRLIQFRRGNSAQQKAGLLVVLLLGILLLHDGAAVSEIREKFSIRGKFEEGISGSSTCQPNVAVLIHKNGVLGSGPAGRVVGAAPGAKKIALDVELEHRGRGHAAFRRGRAK